MRGAPITVRAVDAWGIARSCALAAERAGDVSTCRSLINIRDTWINIANECELLARQVTIAPQDLEQGQLARRRPAAS